MRQSLYFPGDFMCGGSGGSKSGGGGGDAGQPGEVVRAADIFQRKERMAKIIKENIEAIKTKSQGLKNLDKAISAIEAGGQFNYGKKDFALWNTLNSASEKGQRDIDILRIRSKNILKRGKEL